MRGTSIALAAVLLGAAGGMAFGQPPAQPNGAKLTTQTTGNPAATPTINPYTPHNQNPLVNPNAAGTQMGWTGYDRTSGATEVRQPTTIVPRTRREARLRLRQLGYHRITNLRDTAGGGWIAQAHWGPNVVTVQLNSRGLVVAQR
ncbi:MAG TPA: hypothetical protein VFX06_17105 [Stellaceae bacterium]|nr:hypothetical protein [Stellaceae bacterium]